MKKIKKNNILIGLSLLYIAFILIFFLSIYGIQKKNKIDIYLKSERTKISSEIIGFLKNSLYYENKENIIKSIGNYNWFINSNPPENNKSSYINLENHTLTINFLLPETQNPDNKNYIPLSHKFLTLFPAEPTFFWFNNYNIINSLILLYPGIHKI